ncbi:MAG: adenylyltransferase/cytidyltransferase family protein [Desulfobacterales bacterium]|nr:adenylyltransferase/cytidyltransferase family protein [Desulfobacterales bacterium]
MKRKFEEKMLTLDGMIHTVREFRKQNKKVVLSHGVFDLIHPGIVNHLRQAKSFGDVLVVTVIRDSYVKRGARRPVFPENNRLENIAALEDVDYICLVESESPFEPIKQIQPDIFAKGQAFYERDRDVLERIFEEEKKFYVEKCQLLSTKGLSLDSELVLTQFMDKPSVESESYLKNFKLNYKLEDIITQLNALNKLNVLVIGDGIIDEYHYCASMGKSAKSHLVVSRYLSHEIFAGGTFAVANHIAGICNQVHMVTLLGDEFTREEFIRGELKPNVIPQFFYKKHSPTIVKKRYINEYLNQKLFEVNYINDEMVDNQTESQIIDYLKEEAPKYDLVMVCDFGHGLLSSAIINAISNYSQQWAANAQINAANVGYNLVTKFNIPDFICMDEAELRTAAQSKYDKIEDVAEKIRQKINAKMLICTLGKKGSIGVSDHEEMIRTPVFSGKVVDTVGAGDAFFAFVAPCYAQGMSLELISFIGNAVGALAVQIVGNKKPVEKGELLEFIRGLLR